MKDAGAADGVEGAGVPKLLLMLLPLEAPKLLNDGVVPGAPKGLAEEDPKARLGLLSELTF